MKRIIFSFLIVPVLISCKMAKPEYYDAGYYHSDSAPPRSEQYGFDEQPHKYRYHRKSQHQEHKKIKVQSNRGASNNKQTPSKKVQAAS